MHKDLPTTEEMENVWLFDPNNVTDQQKTLLLWYLDTWLPEAVGHDFWDLTARTTRLITDRALLPGDKSKEKKVLVPISGEAFGLLMFKNCRERWIASFEYQAENGTKKVPVYKKDDPDTHAFQNLWSSSRGGRNCGGGWDVKAFKYYNDMIRHLKIIRQEEAANNDPRFQKGLELMRIKHKKRMEKGLPKRREAKKPKPDKRSSNAVVIEIVDE